MNQYLNQKSSATYSRLLRVDTLDITYDNAFGVVKLSIDITRCLTSLNDSNIVKFLQ